MSKDKTTPSRPAKKFAPTRLEVAKTVIIAVMVTGIVAFIAGMSYAGRQNARVAEAVKAVTQTEQVEAAKPSK